MNDNVVVDRVLALLMPVVNDLGLTLWDCEWAGGTLRITLDKPPTEVGHLGSVTLEELTLATRLFNREIDHAEPAVLPENHSLEVSSPGLERLLRQPEHFRHVVGATIAVRLRDVVDGLRRVQGTLVAADDEAFEIRDDETGDSHRIGYERLDRARTVFVWGPTPKPGGSKPGGSKAAAVKPAGPKAKAKADSSDDSSIVKNETVAADDAAEYDKERV